MTLLRLFYEFFLIGLFSVGGGMATVPFLQDLSARTGWFSTAELLDMIAVAESTPGPIGSNMAAYAGFKTAGVFGAIVSVLSEAIPGLIIIMVIAGFLRKFRDSRIVNGAFSALRPASLALIAAAGAGVARTTLFPGGARGASLAILLPQLLLLAALIIPMLKTKLHPLVFIAVSAVFGILFMR
ncbi:MAG: chromate transporter [Oscillospiraceae bacterium]|jgi:chromate transporter|nr:chromate transporter [Oscillospiraceae bacterium]